VADLTAQFNRALQTNQIKSFQSLFDKADSLNKQFLVSGELNDLEYKNIIEETQNLIEPQKIDEIQGITQILEPVLVEPIPPETPIILLSPKDKKNHQELNLTLFRGKKRIYEATYQHKAGRTETIGPIQARSLFDASQQAQRRRKSSKQIPRKGSIRLIGETKK